MVDETLKEIVAGNQACAEFESAQPKFAKLMQAV